MWGRLFEFWRHKFEFGRIYLNFGVIYLNFGVIYLNCEAKIRKYSLFEGYRGGWVGPPYILRKERQQCGGKYSAYLLMYFMFLPYCGLPSYFAPLV